MKKNRAAKTAQTVAFARVPSPGESSASAERRRLGKSAPVANGARFL